MMVERRGWRVHALRLWLPLGFFLLFELFPFYWMAVTSKSRKKPSGSQSRSAWTRQPRRSTIIAASCRPRAR